MVCPKVIASTNYRKDLYHFYCFSYFFTSNGGDLQFFARQIGPLTDIFDTFGGTSDITTVISAINMLCYFNNDTGREGVNIVGDQGVKCEPRGVFSNCGRKGL